MPSARISSAVLRPRSNRRSRRTRVHAAFLATALTLTLGAPAALAATPLGGMLESTLPGVAPTSPQELGEGATTDLLYADVVEGLSQIQGPEANSGGTADLSYPIQLPQGRGKTPEVALTYSSADGSSWAGLGWDLSVGEVSVDTTFGAPRFCDGSEDKKPTCGNVESESYLLDGDPLVPNAVNAVLEPRVAERQDFTRRVETEFEQIIRHGDKPSNYWWEVRDKKGGVRFYGGTPDSGGPKALPGTKAGIDDHRRKPSDILTDANDNGVRWMLSAQRDVGVNMFRYQYETVLYKRDTGATTGWSPLTAGAGCPEGEVCAKHIFLDKILYTAAATASGQPEDPVYEVRFIRTPGGRTDARLDARTGVLDLDQDLLSAIEVRYVKTDKVVTRYELDYDKDPHFSKTRLLSVTQIGCQGLTECPADGLKHTFSYFDDVAEANTGFDAPTLWHTGDQPAGQAVVPDKISALGTAVTNAGDGKIYVGFNPTRPNKTGSAGGSFAMNGATNESIVEFMDLNGDGLPDKIYRKYTDVAKEPGVDQNEPDRVEKMVLYQLNTSRPSTGRTQQVTFGPMHKLSGFERLPIQRSIGIQGGIEAYFGAYGVFNVGGQWSWVDSYFSDVNGDGLPDLVKGNTVLFNHLECTTSLTGVDACLPSFNESDAGTRVPLTPQTVPMTDEGFEQMVKQLREAIPPVDTVRRWTAPYGGKVTVKAKATLTTPADGAAGAVRLAIQYRETEQATGSVSAASRTWEKTIEVDVTKGQSLYFRTGSRPLGNGDEVTWDADITYAGGAVPDANGLDQRTYSLADDFTLAGRPGLFRPVGNGGTASFATALDKRAATSDDLLPEVLVRSGASNSTSSVAVAVTPITTTGSVDAPRVKTIVEQNGSWCVSDATTSFGCFPTESDAKRRQNTLGKAETGRFRITAAPLFAEPVKDAKGVVTSYDSVHTRLSVDSPIDLSAITWIEAAGLCFRLTNGTCDETKTSIAPQMDIDTYAHIDSTGPVTAWSSTMSRTVQPRLVATIGADSPGGDIVVTAKTSSGVVYKETLTMKPGAHAVDEALPDLSLTKGTDYWLDVSVRGPGLSANLSDVDLKLTWSENGSGKTLDVPQTLNWVGGQGHFPVAYRGWAAAGYTAAGARATSALKEGDFAGSDATGRTYQDEDEACQALYGGPCPDDTTVNQTGFDKYPAGSGSPPQLKLDRTTRDVPKAFAFNPLVDGASKQQRWEGPKAKIFAAEAGLTGSARVGEDLPVATASGGGTTKAPSMLGETGPIFMLMAGAGPFSGSFAAGWARSLVDYVDMNGDSFPDTVRPNEILYTNPRGTQECGPADNRVKCTGDGVTTVNSSTTLAVSGGFGGAPIGVSGNTKGATNSTKGNAATKGSSASDTSFGANIGGSLGGGGSFTNPTSQNQHQDDQALTKVPRDKTIPVNETIADINGDGLPDRISVDADDIRVRLNLGHSFTKELLWTVSAFSSTNSYSGSVGASLGFNVDMGGFSGGVSKNANVDLPNVAWEDVNGDGLLDALYSKDGAVSIAFSTGTGLMNQDVYGHHQSLDYPIVGPIEAQGKEQIRQDTSESVGGGVDITIGIPLCGAACYLILNPGGHFENSVTSTDVDLVDVNGDGFADTVRRVKGSGDIEVSLNTQGRSGLLKTVTTPMGGKVSLDYHRDGNTTAHPGSRWVLDEVVVDASRGADGIAQRRTTLSYGTPKYDFVHRADVGYDRVTEQQHYKKWNHTDVNKPKTTDAVRTIDHRYLNGSVFESGLEAETTVYDGTTSGKAVQRTRSTWALKDLDKGAAPGPYAALDLANRSVEQLLDLRVAPQLAKVEQDWYQDGVLEQTSTTLYAYDRLGNPIRVEDQGLPGTAADDSVATMEYSTCTTSSSSVLQSLFGCGDTLKSKPATPAPFWAASLCQTWVSQPVSIVVTGPSGTILRSRQGHTAFCDNASVSVLRELLTPAGGGGGPAAYAETRMAYDAYGSYDRIVLPPDASGMRYAVRYTYDDVNHANVAEVTDYELRGSGDPAGTDPADTARPFLMQDLRPTGDAVGNTSRAAFDGPTGRVRTRVDANGNITAYAYDSYSRIRTITSPDGGVATFAYAPAATYPYATVTHTDELNVGTTLDTATYVDGSGRITGRKRDAVVFDPLTGTTSQGYAAEGASDVDGLGRTIHEWKPFVQVGKTLADYTVDPADPGYDKATLTAYDALDRVVDEQLSNKARTRTAYGFEPLAGYGTLATIDVLDPQGRATKTWLDAHDNVVLSEDRSAPVEDDPDTPADETDPGGVALRTDYTYDRLGQLLKVVSPGNLTTTHTYDLLGRRTSTTTPDGGLVEWEYDLAGNKTSEQSPVLREENDVETVFGYDFGLLTSITYPEEKPLKLDYGGYLGHPKTGNAAGRLVHVEDKARTQTFEYDVNGRLAKDVTTMTGPHPNTGPFTTTYDNDWLGRLRSVSLPDDEVVSNAYDAGGRLAKVTGSRDCTQLGVLSAAVDAQVTTITVTEYEHADPASSFSPALPFTITVGGEQMRVTARVAGSTSGTWDYTVVRGINGTVEAPTAAAHAAGASMVSDSLTLRCVYRYVDQQKYDVYGQVSQRLTGNGVVSTTYRDFTTRRLDRQVAVSPDGLRELQDQRYEYDLVGNVLRTRNDLPEDVPSLFGGPSKQKFTYDGRYRLRSAEGDWTYAPKSTRKYTWAATLQDDTSKVTRMAQRDWTFDTACTRRCKEDTQEATTFDKTAYTYDGAKPHQARSVYDAVTKETEQYEYDSDGEQFKVTNPDTVRDVTWDWAGKMVSVVDHNTKGTGKKQTDYVYDYAGQLAIEIKEQGVTYYVNPWVTVRNGTMSKNIWAGNDRLAVKFSDDGGTYETRLYFLHKDLQGSTNIVTNREGKVFQHQEYFPTGQVWIREDSTTFRTPYQFAGGYTDEDHGLVNLGDRWYAPGQAQFLTVDPILTDDPLSMVQHPTLLSAYTYANSNSTSFVDADGRQATRANLDPSDVLSVITKLQPEGEPIKAYKLAKIQTFFKDNMNTARGHWAMGWLKNFNKYEKNQKKYFGRLDSRPVIEFEVKDGKLKAIKLGFGIFKRAKIWSADDGAGTTPQAASSVQSKQANAAPTAGTAPAGTPNPSPAPASTDATATPTSAGDTGSTLPAAGAQNGASAGAQSKTTD